MWNEFVQKLEAVQRNRSTDILLFLNPQLEALSAPASRYDEPFFPFGKMVIKATQDIVCGYVFDLASYLAPGAAGAIALERTIRFVDPESVTILHGPFHGPGYSPMADATGFGVDALTLVTEADLPAYLHQPPYAAFVLAESTPDHKRPPERGGLFFPRDKLFTLRATDDSILSARLTDETLLFASRFDDFAQVLRTELEAMR